MKLNLKDLGLDRLAVWKRAAAPPLLPGTGQRDELRARLIADFQRARFGVTCRTLGFPARIEGESVHYRALAVTAALDQWIVQRVTERAVQVENSAYPVATPNRDVAVVKTGLGFFDALEHLARYERAQDQEPCGQSRDELGNDHYEAFGLLHDIVTDMQGMPQPSIGGHPVTSGQFPQTGLQALGDARQKTALKDELAQQALQQAVNLQKTANADSLIAGFEEFCRKKGAANSVAKASALIEGWVMLFQQLQETERRQLDMGWSFERGEPDKIINVSKRQMTKDMLKYFCWDWSFEKRMNKLYEDSVSQVDSGKEMEKADRKLVNDLLREMYEIGLLEDAKALMKIATSNQKCEKDPLEMVKTLSVQYAGLKSFEKNLLDRRRFMTRVLSEPPMPCLPDYILKIVADLKASCAARKAEARVAQALVMPHNPVKQPQATLK